MKQMKYKLKFSLQTHHALETFVYIITFRQCFKQP